MHIVSRHVGYGVSHRQTNGNGYGEIEASMNNTGEREMYTTRVEQTRDDAGLYTSRWEKVRKGDMRRKRMKMRRDGADRCWYIVLQS